MATTVTLKPNAIDISGSTSGTTTLQATAVAGTTTLTLPAATDTLVGKATTDTLTNKTLTSPTISANLTFTGTGNRITGDFSTGTFANRVAFQTSTTNSQTALTVLPNGTNVNSALNLYDNSDPTNAGRLAISQSTTSSSFTSGITGTGSYVPMTFTTGGSERVRIDTSGNFLVGTTSAPSTQAKLNVVAAAGATYSSGIIQSSSNTAGDLAYPILYLGKFDNDSTTSQILVRFSINNFGSGQGQINGNGAGAVAFGSFSDSRLKENIVDLPPQLANIMALRPVEYDYIESEGGGHQLGFIAQEVQAIYPDLVGEREDGMLTLSDMNKNDARLIKAIQEQQALITALTARITALESN